MLELPGYRVTDQVRSTREVDVFAGIRLQDNRPVFVKRYASDPGGPDGFAAREHAALSSFTHPGIVRPIELQESSSGPVLILERCEGTPFGELPMPVSLSNFFDLAESLTEAVLAIHTAGWIHAALEPGDILMVGGSRVCIVHFDCSFQPGSRTRPRPVRSEQGLAFLAPEATGRVCRTPDARSDLFALGGVFHLLLTGTPPIQCDDPLDQIHAQLAINPSFDGLAHPDLPAGISRIVGRLLAKEPERRLPSARALLDELRALRTSLEDPHPKHEASGSVAGSGLAMQPQLPAEQTPGLDPLLAGFRRAARGRMETLVIQGPAGLGITSLVDAFSCAVTQEGSRLLRGSFDASAAERPYQGLVRALDGLVDQLRAEGHRRYGRTRVELEQSMGDAVTVATRLAPRLSELFGLAHLRYATSEDLERRTPLVAARLVRELARRESPLVIWLDGIEHCDTASLSVLEELSREPAESLLLVLTHEAGHELPAPVERLLADMQSNDVSVQRSQIQPLAAGEVATWLAAALGIDASRAQAWAPVLLGPASGDPVHMEELLHAAIARGDLTPHPDEAWCYAAQREAPAHAADLAALVRTRVDALPDEARTLVRRGACLGAMIDCAAGALLLGTTDTDSVRDVLVQLVDRGWLLPARGGFRFAHERVRALAGAAVANEAPGLHAELLAHHPVFSNVNELACFEAAEHVAASLAILRDGRPELRLPALRSCILAARRSLALQAPASARSYLEVTRALVEAAGSEVPDTLRAEIQLLRARTCSRFGDQEGLLRELEGLDLRSLDPLSRAETACMRVRAVEERDPKRALQIAIEACREFGMSLPSSVSPMRARFALKRLRRQAFQRSGDLPELPRVTTDPEARARALVLSRVSRIARSSQPALYTYVVARSVEQLLSDGDTGDASLRIAECAELFCGELCDFESGRLATTLALQLGERPDRTGSAEARLIAHGRVQPWFGHPRIFLDDLQALGKHCEQILDPAGAVRAWLARADLLMAAGEPLPRLARELSRISEFAGRSGQGSLHAETEARLRALQRLTDSEGEEPDGDSILLAGTTCGAFQATSAYVLGDFHAVIERRPTRQPTSRDDADAWFFVGLAAAALSSSGVSGGDRRHRRLLHQTLELAKRWAGFGPENFEHQLSLLRAERLRDEGKHREAVLEYMQSLERADALGYVHHAAILCERQTSLWLELNLAGQAARTLRGALARYGEWGAAAKVLRLEAEYSELLPAFPDRSQPAAPSRATTETTVSRSTGTTSTGSSTSSTSSTVRTTQTLDLTTVLRSSEAITGEVQLDRVLERVMSIAIENAGAERSVLLLESDNELYLNAEGSVGGTTLHLREPIPLSRAADQVPHNLIQYVQRTRRIVVLGNASTEGLFSDDPYVVQTRAKSILCLPVVRQANLVGVLYLENALVSNAFTEERVEVLGLLSSQAAISLANARLYYELTNLNRDLERRVEQRTEELREARDVAEAATRAKSQFLAVMSHEIRTPMNVVIGMAQLLRDSELTDDQRDCVQAVHTAGDSLLAIINDILDFSKIEAGKLELETISFSLRDCVEDVAEILASKARDKGLEFPVFIDRSLPDSVKGDPARLKQIIINFVNNAIKFTDEGEVQIRVRPTDSAASDSSETRIRFEVRDTGIGIPKDRIHRLFQSFSQVDASTTRKYGGTGLGLAISKRLAEAMGGQVGVESEEGQGSTFWFEVALWRGEQPEIETLPVEDPATSCVIVRHANLASAICEQLATLGLPSAPFESPQAALESLGDADLAGRLIFSRYPIPDPEWRTSLAAMSARGAKLFLIASLHDRPQAESDFEDQDASLITWPIKRHQLRAVVAQTFGIEVEGAAPLRKELEESTLRARSRFQILVAEDYVLNQKLAVRLLAHAGYQCDVVDDGRKVLEATASGSYDLVLIDCQMPIMDGFEATRQIRIREQETGGHLPIIAMTANAMKGDRERCLEAGMDDYLSKPIRVEALYSLLEKYLPDNS